MELLELAPDERGELAARIDGWVRAAKIQKGDIGLRWLKNEQFYRNQPPGRRSKFDPDRETIHMPLTQPKIDALVGNVVQTILGNEPYVLVKLRGPRQDRVEPVEQDLHYLMEAGAFDVSFDEGTLITALCGVGIVRVTFAIQVEGFGAQHEAQEITLDESLITNEGEIKIRYAGIEFSAIHPGDFICYPANVKQITGAKMTGHRYFRRVQEIKEKIQSGEFYETDIQGGDSPTEEPSGRDYSYAGGSPTVGIDDPLDELVECWSLIIRLDLDKDGVEEMYEVEFAESSSALLSIRKYELSRPWYVDLRFHQEYGGFFPAGSPAQNLQGLQIANNEVHNMLLDGSEFSAVPPVFVDGNAFNAQVQRYYKPGEIIPVEGGMQPYSPTSRFDAGALPLVAQYISQFADQAVRISNNGTGTQMRSGVTATEVAQIASGQNQGLNRYIQMIGMGVEQIARLVLELYTANFDVLKALHGDALRCEDPPPPQVRLEVNGKTPINTAAARLASSVQLLQVLMPIAQMVGVDLYELAKAVIEATELPNADKILMPKEEFMAMQQQQAAMAAEQMMMGGGGGGDVGAGLSGAESGMEESGDGADQAGDEDSPHVDGASLLNLISQLSGG